MPIYNPKISIKESNRNHFNACPTICLCLNNLISRCTVHGGRPLDNPPPPPSVFAWYIFCATHKTIHKKRTCYDRDINLCLPQKSLYSRNTKTIISTTICTHSRGISLWQNMARIIQMPCITSICFLSSLLYQDIGSHFSIPNLIWILWRKLICVYWQGLSQYVSLFYTKSNSSEIQNYKSIISTDFSFIFIFKQRTEEFSLLILLWDIIFNGYLVNWITVL